MLSPSGVAATVILPNQGWIIFGGFDNALTTAQKLRTLDGQWEAGPRLYQSTSDYFSCAVQVN